jgi:hypothetical protein
MLALTSKLFAPFSLSAGCTFTHDVPDARAITPAPDAASLASSLDHISTFWIVKSSSGAVVQRTARIGHQKTTNLRCSLLKPDDYVLLIVS